MFYYLIKGIAYLFIPYRMCSIKYKGLLFPVLNVYIVNDFEGVK